jgi:hypothetical protein
LETCCRGDTKPEGQDRDDEGKFSVFSIDQINNILTIFHRQNSSNATNKSSCMVKSMERSIGRIAPFFFFFLLFLLLFFFFFDTYYLSRGIGHRSFVAYLNDTSLMDQAFSLPVHRYLPRSPNRIHVPLSSTEMSSIFSVSLPTHPKRSLFRNRGKSRVAAPFLLSQCQR